MTCAVTVHVITVRTAHEDANMGATAAALPGTTPRSVMTFAIINGITARLVSAAARRGEPGTATARQTSVCESARVAVNMASRGSLTMSVPPRVRSAPIDAYR